MSGDSQVNIITLKTTCLTTLSIRSLKLTLIQDSNILSIGLGGKSIDSFNRPINYID